MTPEIQALRDEISALQSKLIVMEKLHHEDIQVAQVGDVIGWGTRNFKGRVDRVAHRPSGAYYTVTSIRKDCTLGFQRTVYPWDAPCKLDDWIIDSSGDIAVNRPQKLP
jgi:hypothetical protein